MSIHPIMQKLAAKLERTDLPDFAPATLSAFRLKSVRVRKSVFRHLKEL